MDFKEFYASIRVHPQSGGFNSRVLSTTVKESENSNNQDHREEFESSRKILWGESGGGRTALLSVLEDEESCRIRELEKRGIPVLTEDTELKDLVKICSPSVLEFLRRRNLYPTENVGYNILEAVGPFYSSNSVFLPSLMLIEDTFSYFENLYVCIPGSYSFLDVLNTLVFDSLECSEYGVLINKSIYEILLPGNRLLRTKDLLGYSLDSRALKNIKVLESGEILIAGVSLQDSLGYKIRKGRVFDFTI